MGRRFVKIVFDQLVTIFKNTDYEFFDNLNGKLHRARFFAFRWKSIISAEHSGES